MSKKINSKYQRKNGTIMKQINLAVKEDIADKFNYLCDGLSKSAIFSQWVNEKAKKMNLIEPSEKKVNTKSKYSILGD